MSSRQVLSKEQMLHDFRNWLYLLNADTAYWVARGRKEDPSVHAAQSVPFADVAAVYLKLNPPYAHFADALLAYGAQLDAYHLQLSQLNWRQEYERAQRSELY